MAYGDLDWNAFSLLNPNDDRVRNVLSVLDRTQVDEPNSRQERRYEIRLRECLISLQQPGSSTPVVHRVPLRNISTMGLAFLHRGYVHVGSFCKVRMMGQNGQTQTIAGEVMHCEYIRSVVHLVGVRFTERARLSELSVKLDPIVVAVYDEQRELFDLVQEKLCDPELFTVVTAPSMKQFESLVKEMEIDLLIGCAFDMCQETVDRVRELRFKRPIVVIGAVSRDEASNFALVIEDTRETDVGAQITRLVRG